MIFRSEVHYLKKLCTVIVSIWGLWTTLDHFSIQSALNGYYTTSPQSSSSVRFVKLEKLLLFSRLERTWALWAGIHSVITLLGYTEPGATGGRDEWHGGAAINNVFTRAMEAHRSCGQIRHCIEMCRWIDWPIGFSVEIIQINWKHGEEKAGRREIARPMIYRPCSKRKTKWRPYSWRHEGVGLTLNVIQPYLLPLQLVLTGRQFHCLRIKKSIVK